MAISKSEKLGVDLGSYLAWGALHDDTKVGVIVRATATRWVVQTLRGQEIQVTRSGLNTAPAGAEVKRGYAVVKARLVTSSSVKAAREDFELRKLMRQRMTAVATTAHQLVQRFGYENALSDLVGDQLEVRDVLTWLAEVQMMLSKIAKAELKVQLHPPKSSR